MEPLLSDENNRYTLFPIQYDDIWSMCKKQLSLFWTAEEIDLSKDLNDWNTLSDGEQYFIKMILCFFSSSDGIVLENLALRFIDDVKVSEVRYFFSNQMFMENIHSEVYSLLIDTYVKDKDEKNKLFNAIDNFDCINKKAKWAIKYIQDKTSSFATRLLAFSIVEAIYFSGSFCSIFWMKKRGLLKGLTFSNDLINKDEALHAEFSILLYSKLNNKLNENLVFDIVKEAVEIEKEFINDALPCRLIGMNAELMSQYIEFVADRLLIQLGYNEIYNTSNPFSWMESISLEGKQNMFEGRVDSYSLAEKSKTGDEFNLDENCF